MASREAEAFADELWRPHLASHSHRALAARIREHSSYLERSRRGADPLRAFLATHDDPSVAEVLRRHDDAIDIVGGAISGALAREAMRRLAARGRLRQGSGVTVAQLIARFPERLAPAGQGRWKGLCPFHPDRRPSLTVFEDGHFRCWACQRHGPLADLARAWHRATA